MKKNKSRGAVSLLLCLIMLAACLSGCGSLSSDAENTDVQSAENQSESETEQAGTKKPDNTRFTLRYAADESLNPYLSDNVYNEVLMSLMYESLFRLDDNFQPIPVLCESCETEDGLTFTITLIEAKMHDGSDLKAGDVVYSINLARSSSKYGKRLAHVDSCYTDYDGRVVLVLDEVNYNISALLDFPIICTGTYADDVPAGTGPYVLKQTGTTATLKAFDEYRDKADISEKTIYLSEYEDDVVEDSFSTVNLDLIWEDPNDDVDLHLYGEYESRCYDTTILQYVGFNFNRTALKDINVRKAICCAVDRTMIVDEINSGFGREADMLYNPSYYLYKSYWAEPESFSLANMSAYLAASALKDTNSDGYLEYSYDGYYDTLVLRFLVYSGSDKKVAAAQSIADNLNRVGLNVQVTALDWQEYLSALANGEYELYYGEISLTHDFDFTDLLTPEGSLCYGLTGSEKYAELIAAVKEASDEEALNYAVGGLCAYAVADVPIIPVMYRQNVVYTHRGEVIGLRPTVSGIFQSVTEWHINLSKQEGE